MTLTMTYIYIYSWQLLKIRVYRWFIEFTFTSIPSADEHCPFSSEKILRNGLSDEMGGIAAFFPNMSAAQNHTENETIEQLQLNNHNHDNV